MKTSHKVLIGMGALVLLVGTGWFASYEMKKGVVTVQTGQVQRQDVTSVVTASGEIRPQNYTNVVGQGIGLITDIIVKEGDHVTRGTVLGQLGCSGRCSGPHVHYEVLVNGKPVNPLKFLKAGSDVFKN